MCVTESGILMFLRDVQPLNASPGKSVIVLPGRKSTVTNFVQSLNTPLSKSVTDDGIDMEVILSLPENALRLMEVTSYPPSVDGMTTAPPEPEYPVIVASLPSTEYSQSPSVAASAPPEKSIKQPSKTATRNNIAPLLRNTDLSFVNIIGPPCVK